ncbi:unnamed protein product [Penicillium nalgiovense]|uniref:Uncharacterized protein n=1 Tax=Penicillium nalgiovense TaxID=60175 RepID=A0A9W4HZX6_PENNA|nr:unnamed protein product [Penicillium nalgiovense]CAG8082287.1 unnamed protein product [Penicillium nalgiovense]CAG8088074.1 unnamed protein product [Penicillium nalgiovense]CAG8089876.1 unnamed protein product [Penicillium nalgiovense]CAG8126212.1 unnamed protein product [Penicillium nalgiovense]
MPYKRMCGISVIQTSPRRQPIPLINDLSLSKNRRNQNTPRKAMRGTEGSGETVWMCTK